VHVPCCFDPFWEPGVVHVFTLGDASWRDVQAGPDARCSLGRSSLVDVDGMVYWMTEFTARVMAFDLEEERVTRTAPLPIQARPSACRLTKVHARLGVAVTGGDSLTVWVLEGDRELEPPVRPGGV
jgi:F-box interacting protein